MKSPRCPTVAVNATWPSEQLRGAALAGLLCLATVACSTKDDAGGVTSSGGAAGDLGLGGAEAANGAAGARAEGGAQGDGEAGEAAGGGMSTTAGAASNAPEAGAGGAAGLGGATATGGAAAGAGGAPPEPPHITSSENVGVLTEEQFQALCDARGGTVEVMPHCGGFATAKGFSYDNVTLLLSEHTCAGANTCGGWNCVLTE